MERLQGLLLLLTAHALVAADVKIARWQGDATAAVSLISDDYGQLFWGDVKFVESICDQTGVKLTMAMNTHGSIGRAVQIYDAWNAARRLTKKGHEFHSHSANHSGKDWSGAEMDLQVIQSQKKLEDEIPGWKPMMFFFPNKSADKNGQKNEIAFIRRHQFIGIRPNGSRPMAGFAGVTPGDVPQPFSISTIFYQERVGPKTIIDKVIGTAIKSKAWATPSFHCIGKRAGWVHINKEGFTQICKAIQAKSEKGQLWSAGAQRVLMYALERNSYKASLMKNSKGYKVSFKKTVPKIAESPKVDDSVFNVPLTLILDLPKEVKSARQGKTKLKVTRRGNSHLIDADPQGGDVRITLK